MTADVCYASGGIQPYAIPGADLDPDAVIAAANSLSSGGASVRDAGADLLSTWRGLGAHYEAPEAGQLFSVMDPVESSARDFGDAVQQVATVLKAYAEEIRPIKASLLAVKRDALAFRRTIASNSEWQYDQDLVDQNTDLVERVNAAQVRLWEAERTCANGIRALYCAAPWHAATSADDPLGYGVSEIPADAPMAWGSSVERQDHCPKSAAVGVKRFVWDGVVVDGLWGTVVGLGALVGVKDWKWSADNFTESWTAMGGLIGYADGEWAWGNAGDSWLALGKGLIAYDTWEDDPGRAAGGALFNIATIVIPAGAAVSGTKAAATAAGTTGRAASLLSRGARIIDFTDPISVLIKGGQFAVPKLGDLLTGMRAATEGLGDALRIADAPVNLDAPTSTLDDLSDAMPARRDPDVETAPAPAAVEAPVPANQLVGPDGSPIHDTPGGTGTGGDDLAGPQAPPAGPIHAPGTDAPTGGSSHGSGSTTGSGGSGPTAHGDVPSTAGGSGDIPSGASDSGDVPSGDPVPNSPGVAGSGGVPPSPPPTSGLSSTGAPPSESWVGALTRELNDRGLSQGEFDGLVAKNITTYSEDTVRLLMSVRDALPQVSIDDTLLKILPPDVVRNSLTNHPGLFDSFADARMRDAANASSRTYTASRIDGFVLREVDGNGLTSNQFFHDLGLDYDGQKFTSPGQTFDGNIVAVRYPASSVIDEMGETILPSIPRTPLQTMHDALYQPATDGHSSSLFEQLSSVTDPAARAKGWQAYADTQGAHAGDQMAKAIKEPTGAPGAYDPFRGNGFSGSGQGYLPEYDYASAVGEVPQGAEMIVVRPDGSRSVVATFRIDRWMP